MAESMAVNLAAQLIQYGGPAMVALALLAAVIVFGMARWLKTASTKSEADRAEHQRKWDSMVHMQSEAIRTMAEAHGKEIDRVMAAQKEEINRLFLLHERKADAMDLMARMLTLLTQKVDSNLFCPIIRENAHVRETGNQRSPAGG